MCLSTTTFGCDFSVTRLEAPVERPLESGPGGGGGNAPMHNVSRFYYEHWIAHTTDQPPSGSNGWSMALEGFTLERASLYKQQRLHSRAIANYA